MDSELRKQAEWWMKEFKEHDIGVSTIKKLLDRIDTLESKIPDELLALLESGKKIQWNKAEPESKAMKPILSSELKERADCWARVGETVHTLKRTILDILNEIDAHEKECHGKPVASAVSEELRANISDFLVYRTKSVKDASMVRELHAIADAQPDSTGWVEGPPTECCAHVYERKDNGELAFSPGGISDENCARHVAIPERTPPKTTPLVDCCEKGKRKYFFGDGEWKLSVDGKTEDYNYVHITHCQWCGTKLTELG